MFYYDFDRLEQMFRAALKEAWDTMWFRRSLLVITIIVSFYFWLGCTVNVLAGLWESRVDLGLFIAAGAIALFGLLWGIRELIRSHKKKLDK